MSMLRYIEEASPNTKITLFYAVRTENDVIFQKDLGGCRNGCLDSGSTWS